jgi:hypothetical protein
MIWDEFVVSFSVSSRMLSGEIEEHNKNLGIIDLLVEIGTWDIPI